MKTLLFLFIASNFLLAEEDLFKIKDSAKEYYQQQEINKYVDEQMKKLTITLGDIKKEGNTYLFNKKMTDYLVAKEITARNFQLNSLYRGGLPAKSILLGYSANYYQELKREADRKNSAVDMKAFEQHMNTLRARVNFDLKLMTDHTIYPAKEFDIANKLFQGIASAAKKQPMSQGAVFTQFGANYANAMIDLLKEQYQITMTNKARPRVQNDLLNGQVMFESFFKKAYDTGELSPDYKSFYHKFFMPDGVADAWADTKTNLDRDSTYRHSKETKDNVAKNLAMNKLIYNKIDASGILKLTPADLKLIIKEAFSEIADTSKEETKNDEIYRSLYNSVYLISTVTRLTGDVQSARLISGAGQGMIEIVSAMNLLSKGTQIGALSYINVAAGLAQGVTSILNALLGLKSDSELILEALQKISKQVEGMRAEIVARLEIIDWKIDTLLKLSLEGFQKILWVLSDLERNQAEIKDAIFKLDENIDDLRGEVKNQFELLHEQTFRSALSVCLSNKEVETADFKYCLRHLSETLENNPLIHKLADEIPNYQSTNIIDYYTKLGKKLDNSPWEKINLISKILSNSFSTNIEASVFGNQKISTSFNKENRNLSDNYNVFNLSSLFSGVLFSNPQFHRLENESIEDLVQSFINTSNFNLQAAANLRKQSHVAIKVLNDYKSLQDNLIEEIKKEKVTYEERHLQKVLLDTGPTNLDFGKQDLSHIYQHEPITPCENSNPLGTNFVGEFIREPIPEPVNKVAGGYARISQEIYPEVPADPKAYPPLMAKLEWNVSEFIPKIFLAAQAYGLGKIHLCYKNVSWNKMKLHIKHANRFFAKTDDLHAHGLVQFDLRVEFKYNEQINNDLKFTESLTLPTTTHIGSFFMTSKKVWQHLGTIFIADGKVEESGWVEGQMGGAYNSGNIVKNVWESANGRDNNEDWLVTKPEKLEYAYYQTPEPSYKLSFLTKLQAEHVKRFHHHLMAKTKDPSSNIGKLMTAMSGNKKLLLNILQITHPVSIYENTLRSLLYGKNGLMDESLFLYKTNALGAKAILPDKEKVFENNNEAIKKVSVFIANSDNKIEDIEPMFGFTLNQMRTLQEVFSASKPQTTILQAMKSYRDRITAMTP